MESILRRFIGSFLSDGFRIRTIWGGPKVSRHVSNMHHGSRPGERGSSLVAVMVALAVLGIAFYFLSQSIEFGMKSAKSLELKNQLEDIRVFVRQSMSCSQTVAPLSAATCGGANIRVRGPLKSDGTPGNILIDLPSTTPTAVGSNFLLRSSCVPCPTCANGQMIYIEVNRVRHGTQTPLPDPLSGAALQNSNAQGWADLFRGVPIGCVVPP